MRFGTPGRQRVAMDGSEAAKCICNVDSLVQERLLFTGYF